MSQLSAGRRRRLAAAMLRGTAMLALATALSGCYSDRQVVDNYPNDVRQRHPIAIREGERALELFVGVNRGALNPSQRADVVAFVRRWGGEATGGFIIEVPAGTANEAAAAGVSREIQSILAAAGVPPHMAVVRHYRPANPMQLATVRVRYPKMLAEAGPCGLWPHDIGPSLDGADFENREYWNLGCASQRNLASMVENPADLVQPRGEVPAYAARRATVLDKYRKGEVTIADKEKEQSGEVSNIKTGSGGGM